VARLSAATEGDITRARRWSNVLDPLGITDEMRVVLRSRDACWGTLTLYRQHAADAPFTERDEHIVADVVAPLADLFRLALLRAALGVPDALPQPPGLVLVSPDGTVEATTPAAAEWLGAIDDRGRVPSAIRVVARAALAGDGLARQLPRDTVGRLHSSVGKDEGGAASGQVAVIVEARVHTMSTVIAGLRAHAARARGHGAVAQGRANRIARTCIPPHRRTI
jgi:hypothetical protein